MFIPPDDDERLVKLAFKLFVLAELLTFWLVTLLLWIKEIF